ncbi:unnamed protein product [Adineta ricciae]|uniref:MARVEL domain-containing protein n=1 Tax=Adineta ricciae TaxID=249248 RepID=A0A815K3L5_ADIRI|nr:unnamed protein product [Adineta ricciae]
MKIRYLNTMTAYFGIFKEPRGLIRLLQFLFAIFAFATACNGSSSLVIQYSSTKTAQADWSYPYNLQNSDITIAMLLSLAFAVMYVLMDRQYRNDERFPIIDLVITVIWTIFWIAGSSAWAQGVTNIRSLTSYDNVVQQFPACGSLGCSQSQSGTYANIIVSVIFGFLNFFLWACCIWFVYKETRFFKSRTAQQQPQQQNNFSNIGAPSMYPPPTAQTQMPGSMG